MSWIAYIEVKGNKYWAQVDTKTGGVTWNGLKNNASKFTTQHKHEIVMTLQRKTNEVVLTENAE